MESSTQNPKEEQKQQIETSTQANQSQQQGKPQEETKTVENWEQLADQGNQQTNQINPNQPKKKEKKKLNLGASAFKAPEPQTQTVQSQQPTQSQSQNNSQTVDLINYQPRQQPNYQQQPAFLGYDEFGFPLYGLTIWDQFGNWWVQNQFGQVIQSYIAPVEQPEQQLQQVVENEVEYEDPLEEEPQNEQFVKIQTSSKEPPEKKKQIKKTAKKEAKKQSKAVIPAPQIPKTFPKKVEVDKNQEALQQLIKQQKKFTYQQLVDIENTQLDKEKYTEVDKTREPVNIVFIGHVDHGKSTLAGRVLKDTGEVSELDIRKYELEAKENHRDNWYLAYIVDINDEERAKGKTVECGRGYFQLKNKRFILLDAPGHKNYVPNMIAGACQADVATLVVSAKSGEFEAGFNPNGQTQEHAQLAKALGVQHVIVAVTKMDACQWQQKRYDQIVEEIGKFLAKNCGFKSVQFVPINSQDGQNISTKLDPSICNWYKGPCLFDYFDNIPLLDRKKDGPIRIPILDVIKDQGMIYVTGKIESGSIKDGMHLLVLPYRNRTVQVKAIYNGRLKGNQDDDTKEQKEQQVLYASSGENVKIKIVGMDEKELQKGYVLCQLDDPCVVTKEFLAKLTLLDLPEHKRIMSQGYKCMLHMHTQLMEVQISSVKSIYDPTTKKDIVQAFLKSQDAGQVTISSEKYMCIEKFDKIPQMGRFTLRDENKTIGYGEVLKYKPITAVPIQGAPIQSKTITEAVDADGKKNKTAQ